MSIAGNTAIKCLASVIREERSLTRTRRSSWAPGLLIIIILAFAAGAHAGEANNPSESADAFCAVARSEGIAHQQSGRMLAARSAFRRCATAACPSKLADACTVLYGEANAASASLVITAKAPDGKATRAVKVVRGDKVLAQRLDATPLALDPGEQRLRFELLGAVAIERTLRLRAGEKRQPLSLTFRALPAAPLAAAPKAAGMMSLQPKPVAVSTTPPDLLTAPAQAGADTSDVMMWTGGTLLGAGVLTGVVAGSIALARRGGIRERCNSNLCSEADIAEGEIPAHVATAGFVAAGAGAAALFIGWLLKPDEKAPTALPVAGPGWLGVSGRF